MGGGRFASWKWDFFFFYLEPRKKKKKKRMKGSCPWWWNRGIRGRLQHVLSLQRMAGGAQSTRGASVHTFLHVHLCVSRAWWWGCVWGERFFHSVVTSHFLYYLYSSPLIDVFAWGACVGGKRGVLLDSRSTWVGDFFLLENMVALDWSWWGTDHTVLPPVAFKKTGGNSLCVLRCSPLHTFNHILLDLSTQQT